MPGYKKVDKYLFLNETSGIFYVRKSFKRSNLPSLFKSLHTSKVSAARTARDEAIREHENHYLGISESYRLTESPPLSQVVTQYLESSPGDFRESTSEQHRIYMNELSRELGTVPVAMINLRLWTAWMSEFRKRKNRKTFFDYSKSMSILLNYAHRMEMINRVPKLPNPDKNHSTHFRVYTDEEISSLWGAMGETTRDQFVLSYECMMRLREALKLTWDRVDLKTGLLTLRPQDVKTGSKTKRGRQFFVTPHALERLRARAKTSESRFVFPSPNDPGKAVHQNKGGWKRAKKLAGMSGRARWHDLRHTALSKALLVAQANPVIVSEYAGVSLKTLMKVYLHSKAEDTVAVRSVIQVPGYVSGEKAVNLRKWPDSSEE